MGLSRNVKFGRDDCGRKASIIVIHRRGARATMPLTHSIANPIGICVGCEVTRPFADFDLRFAPFCTILYTELVIRTVYIESNEVHVVSTYSLQKCFIVFALNSLLTTTPCRQQIINDDIKPVFWSIREPFHSIIQHP